MANRCMKRCSALLIIKKMQITLLGMAYLEKVYQMTNVGYDVEKEIPCSSKNYK